MNESVFFLRKACDLLWTVKVWTEAFGQVQKTLMNMTVNYYFCYENHLPVLWIRSAIKRKWTRRWRHDPGQRYSLSARASHSEWFILLSIVPDNLQFFTVIQGKQDFTFWKAKVSKLWPSVNITGVSRIIVGILSMQDEGQRG